MYVSTGTIIVYTTVFIVILQFECYFKLYAEVVEITEALLGGDKIRPDPSRFMKGITDSKKCAFSDKPFNITRIT